MDDVKGIVKRIIFAIAVIVLVESFLFEIEHIRKSRHVNLNEKMMSNKVDYFFLRVKVRDIMLRSIV